jgi:hypothetical protein
MLRAMLDGSWVMNQRAYRMESNAIQTVQIQSSLNAIEVVQSSSRCSSVLKKLNAGSTLMR